MKRLSICLPALALALVLTLSGAAPGPRSNPLTPAASAHSSSTSVHWPAALPHLDHRAVLALRTPLFPAPTVHPPLLSTVRPNNTRYDIMYYWYTDPDHVYNDYATVADEEWEWYVYLNGVEVDTNPMGGTLLVYGYLTQTAGLPLAFIYAHYTY